ATRYLNQSPISTLQTYDALGNRLSSTDANNHTTQYAYDSLNRLAQTTSAAGVTETQTYNAAGWVIAQTDGLGRATITQYDLMGRPVTVTDPAGNATQYRYDALGSQTAQIDANGVRTRYEYDGLNRLIAVVENQDGVSPPLPCPAAPQPGANVCTQYRYDAVGNQTFITNALGITNTRTVYDGLNRPVIVEDALGNQTVTQYNALGLRTVITDGNGAVTQYAYDGLNRLTTVNYQTDGETVSYSYDALGNRIAMTDSLGVTSYVYDDFSRPITVTDPFTGTVGYGYDAAGNRTQLVYPDGKTATYTYDADNRLTQVNDWNGGLTAYQYDAAGQLVTTTLPAGGQTVNRYDPAGRLIRLTHTDSNGQMIGDYQYQLDGVGNRITATETLAQPGGSGGGPVTWTQTGHLLPANGSAYDYIGEGVAIDGDTLVLGARGHNEAFVYLWHGSQWAEQAYLTPADGAANDRFGYAVAIDGDTIAVGAYLDDDLGADSGSVYIFSRSGVTWTQQAKLTAADGAAGDWFGYAVSLSGDSLIVGAHREDDDGSNAGAAYIFTRSGGVWSQQAKLTAGDAGGNDWFGYAVALSGDTAAVGAPREDGAANNAGSVYVFTRSG
ncbi:MAG TPA: hypothetical protein EYP90_01070, partial [Chromatiaceae bacterium]|nr:hypothetical protein [Chromatiaceae bacterium]